jgi:hypothetical protein
MSPLQHFIQLTFKCVFVIVLVFIFLPIFMDWLTAVSLTLHIQTSVGDTTNYFFCCGMSLYMLCPIILLVQWWNVPLVIRLATTIDPTCTAASFAHYRKLDQCLFLCLNYCFTVFFFTSSDLFYFFHYHSEDHPMVDHTLIKKVSTDI